jgi:DNA (cytosine-5)-methyltransferase 1
VTYRVLDLYCGEGGAATGYRQAGLEVAGADVRRMARYPFPFYQEDAIRVLDHLVRHWAGEPSVWAWNTEFHAVHASPPCNDHQKRPHRKDGTGWLLPATRDRLARLGVPWVIENVPGAEMRPDFRLCGCMFGLEIDAGYLVRERWFETSWHGFDLRPPCQHRGTGAISIAGHGLPSWSRRAVGGDVDAEQRKRLMRCEWMPRDALAEAIPPPYTALVGRHLVEELDRRAAA